MRYILCHDLDCENRFDGGAYGLEVEEAGCVHGVMSGFGVTGVVYGLWVEV